MMIKNFWRIDRLLVIGLFLLTGTAPAAFAQACEESATRHAFATSGEVSGIHEFSAPIGDQWTFLLRRIDYGWAIRLFDSTGVDLTAITPPFRFGVNHRDIEGWHFRNEANTATNAGDVNAPQRDRVFLFSPALEGTGGFRPPDTDTIDFDGSEGRGSLRIHDMGLADLEPGEKARLTYLNFSVCLTWPKSADEVAADADYNNLQYLDEEREIMHNCGLDSAYELNAWMTPRYLSADFDADDAIDDVAQIRRLSDGQRGIAICRAGTWLTVLGMDGEMADDLPENGFGALEAWRVVSRQQLDNSTPGEGAPAPEAVGDALILERVEKSQHVVYWQSGEADANAGFVARTQGRHVEPDR